MEKQSNSRAITLTAAGTIIVLIAAALFVFFLNYKPAYGSNATAQDGVHIFTLPNGQRTATLELNIKQMVNAGTHNDWLGYQTLDVHPGTMFHLPANALVTVTIHNFDSQTKLRNTFFTLVQGTVGNVAYVDGKPFRVMSPNLTSHTFTIADLGVSVPMEGIPTSGTPDHYTMKFSFRTPKGNHLYRWQCIVPCGSGLYGNGGPMSELGYMSGLIEVS
jgi:hypothetical protein